MASGRRLAVRSERKGDFEIHVLEKSGPGSQIWDQEKENTKKELIQNFKARTALFYFFFFEGSVHL